MKKRIISLLLAAFLVLSLVPSAFAADKESTDAADTLYGAGLFRGVGTDSSGAPIYALDRQLNRFESVTMLVRLLGCENTALKRNDRTEFRDLVSWAAPYVGYAYSAGLTNGVSDTKFGGASATRASEYLTFICRALGYSDSHGDFKWDSAWTLTDTLGITHGEYSSGTKPFLRSDAVKVSLAALKTKMKNEDITLIEHLYKNGAVSAKAVCDILNISGSALPDELLIGTEYLEITLPDSWKDAYYYEINTVGDGAFSVSFYEKTSRDSSFGGHLFSIVVGSFNRDIPEVSYKGELTLEDGTKRDVFIIRPSDVQFAVEAMERYTAMSGSEADIFAGIKFADGCKFEARSEPSGWKPGFERALDGIGSFAQGPDDFKFGGYCVYDVDKDGTPELIVRLGSCEADTRYYLFKYDAVSERSTMIAEFGAGHGGICGLDKQNGFVFEYAHQGYEVITKYTLTGTDLTGTDVSERYVSIGQSYAPFEFLDMYDLYFGYDSPYFDSEGLVWYKNPTTDNDSVLASVAG